MDRRRFCIQMAAAAVTSVARPVQAANTVDPSLRRLASTKGLTYGTAVRSTGLTDPLRSALVAREAGILVPEAEGKRRSIEPAPGHFDFAGLDAILGFAGRHQQSVRGHTLIWHGGDPAWLQSATDDADMALASYIRAVLGHFGGRIASWDVVNEALAPKRVSGAPLRSTPWLRALGPDYVAKAFEIARKADPTVALWYNDYGFEYADYGGAAKRTAALELLGDLRRRGLVDGFGIQSHLYAGASLDPDGLRAFLRDAAGLGLTLGLTELDVNDRYIDGPIAVRDRAVAEHLEAWLSVALSEPQVRLILTWGLLTSDSWLNTDKTERRNDGQQTRGLPFDARGRTTAMGGALRRALANAPVRP